MEETKVNIDKTVPIVKKESKFALIVNKFILNPFLAGISGFTVFFLFTILLDFFVNLFVPNKLLSIDIFTVLIGMAGFILAFSFSFLESTQKTSE